MSAWKAERWEDNLFVNSKVHMASRAADGLEADGIIFGFPDDIPYAVVQFDHLEFHARYLVSYEELQKGWVEQDRYYITEAKLLEVIPRKEYVRLDRTFLCGSVKHNRYKHPLRTCFKVIETRHQVLESA